MFTLVRTRFSSVPVKLTKYGSRGCRGFADAVTEVSEAGPIYPMIQDLSPDNRKNLVAAKWHEEIKKIETVEEKIFKVNMPCYYGWKLAYIEEQDVKDASLDHAQFITRTHLMPGGVLPSCYDTGFDENNVKEIVRKIKPVIRDVYQYELGRVPKDTPEENLEYVRTLVYQLNRIIMSSASADYPHLSTTDVDFEPRLEAFWMIGNVERPVHLKKQRAKSKRSQDLKFVHEPVDLPIRYVGSPRLQLKHEHPLKEFVSLEELGNIQTQVPVYPYMPTCLGYPLKRQHVTNIPGYWPMMQPFFGTLSFNSTSHMLQTPISSQPYPDAVKVHAIRASYAWLHAQACYLGFSTFHDITYPLASQMILTNGAEFHFCAYQMNTTLLHSNHAINNPKSNLCWLTQPMELFEVDSDNSLKDINDQVLEIMVKFYINEPTKRENVELDPYLGKTVKRIADIEEDERRVWLDSHYKHLMKNRPRHKLVPEMYHWQKFFLIDFHRRHIKGARELMLARRTLKRRLDDHLPRYIPKILRKDPKKKKVGRWQKTYYP